MDVRFCPGAQAFRQPKPEFIPCPVCHEEVEIWTDQAEAKCDGCGTMVSREMLQGCVDYCASAKECLGEQLYHTVMAAKQRSKETKD
jgi:hypothetical protein